MIKIANEMIPKLCILDRVSNVGIVATNSVSQLVDMPKYCCMVYSQIIEVKASETHALFSRAITLQRANCV